MKAAIVKSTAKKKQSPKDLSPAQKRFDKLTKQVETWKAKVQEEEQRLQDLEQFLAGELPKLREEERKVLVEYFVAVSDKMNEIKLNEADSGMLNMIIAKLLHEYLDAFDAVPELDPLLKKFFRADSNEMRRRQNEQEEEMMIELIEKMLSVDVTDEDLEEIDSDVEGEEKFQALLMKKLRDMEKERFEQDGVEYTEDMLKEKVFETIRNFGTINMNPDKSDEKPDFTEESSKRKLRTLRSIYITLAKVLHPDSESDLEKKLVKEEAMKKVIEAYQAEDLAGLLRLELEWVEQITGRLEKLTDEQIEFYNEALEEQVTSLKEQRQAMRENSHACNFLPALGFKYKNSILQDLQDYLDDRELVRRVARNYIERIKSVSSGKHFMRVIYERPSVF